MRTRRSMTILALMLCGCLALAACTAGGSSTTGTTSTNNQTHAASPTTAPTAVPTVVKPNSVPLTDMAFCQHILSVAEANQFMNPPIPATTIVPNNTSGGGSCNYEYAPLKITLAVILLPWNGPVPIPQADIQAFVTQELAKAGANGVTVSTFTLVSGVGDQAAFLSLVAPPNGFIHKVTVFYVLYGHIFFDCVNYFNVGNSSDATQQSALQQCAQTVVSRL